MAYSHVLTIVPSPDQSQCNGGLSLSGMVDAGAGNEIEDKALRIILTSLLLLLPQF